MDLIYRGQWNDRAKLLQKYNVKYIYVGPIERKQYPNANLDFSEYPGIESVFQNKKVTIYRVNQLELQRTRSQIRVPSVPGNTCNTVRERALTKTR